MEDNLKNGDKESGAREKILLAGRRVFSEKGFHGASVNDVALEAGVNKALLFYYFGSKKNLYQQVLIGIFEKSARIFHSTIESINDVEDRLREIIRAYIRHFSENSDVTIMIMREVIGLGPGLFKPLIEIKRTSQQPLIDTIKEGIRQGKFREVDPQFACDALFGVIHSFFHHPPGIINKISNEELLEKIMDLLKNGLFCRSER